MVDWTAVYDLLSVWLGKPRCCTDQRGSSLPSDEFDALVNSRLGSLCSWHECIDLVREGEAA